MFKKYTGCVMKCKLRFISVSRLCPLVSYITNPLRLVGHHMPDPGQPLFYLPSPNPYDHIATLICEQKIYKTK